MLVIKITIHFVHEKNVIPYFRPLQKKTFYST